MTIVDRVGRRRLLVCAVPGMIIGLIWALITFYCKFLQLACSLRLRRSLTIAVMTNDSGGQLLDGFTYSNALVGSVLGAILVFSISFGLTYSHIVWYQSEFLALEIRAAGSAVATTSCWIANLVVSVAYLTQLENLGAAGTYGLYAALTTMGYIFVLLYYPEPSKF